MDPLALILVYKYLYRNARCPRTTHLLLLLMPAVGIYTASAICCHCRCGSCVTTYFNIMFFFIVVLLFSIAGCAFVCLFQRRFSPFSRHFVFFSTNLFFLLLLFCFTLYNVGFLSFSCFRCFRRTFFFKFFYIFFCFGSC